MNRIISATIGLVLLLAPFSGLNAAENFNPSFLLSDSEFTDYLALDQDGIQHVLDRGYLGNYLAEDVDGRLRPVSEIIWWTAQMYGINPKVLLVMLQKEQSLVEDDSPDQGQLDWALGYGVCDNCNHDTPSIQRWRGLAKQLRSASMQFTEGYLVDIEERGETVMGYGPGITTTIDDTLVTFANAATAALYTYTPHIHGNENFVKLWSRYFGIFYPTGSLLQDKDTGGVYLIQFGKKLPITSRTALYSRYNPNMIIPVDRTVLEAYPDGREISFSNYSLLQAPNGGIYLLVDDLLRPIASQEAFRATGFSPDELISVSWDDINAFELGETITADTEYAQGTLLQDTATGGIYFTQDGVKHPIMSREILANRFTNWLINPTDPDELDAYETGAAVKLMDGTLVKAPASPDVFVISEGLRRPIMSEEVFLGLGYKWENIIIAEERSVLLHELGEIVLITVEDDIETALNQ